MFGGFGFIGFRGLGSRVFGASGRLGFAEKRGLGKSMCSAASSRVRDYLNPKVCRIMAFWAIFKGFGPLFYLLLGSR